MRVTAVPEAGTVPAVSTGDLLRSYRLVSVVTNAPADYAMLEGASVRGTWHLTGAYQDVRKVELDGFAFPLGSNLCTSLWAFTWGKVRPRLGNADARVVFAGDGFSNLPDPNFIARANETNTVELLIGKTYEIKCDLPFRIVDSSDGNVEIWQRSPMAATVVWPVEICIDYGVSTLTSPLCSTSRALPGATPMESPPGGPWLRVDPDWLNGTVSMPTNCCCGVSGTGGEFELPCANGHHVIDQGGVA